MTSGPPRAWQRMLSGRKLDLLHPDPRDIAIEDLAHGLARVARWNGQTRGAHIFSVAQHSILVEAIFGLRDPGACAAERLAALLHDGPEYVIGDLISPFKAVLEDGYKTIEARLLAAVHQHVGLPVSTLELVARIKQADRVAAYIEATELAGFDAAEADRIFGRPDPLEGLPALEALPPAAAERAFLVRFHELRSAGHPERA